MGTTMEDIDDMFDDHPSLNASLRDFEQGSIEIDRNLHPFGYPSQHSGFRSDTDSEDQPELASIGGYSPPAWRVDENGNQSNGFWPHRNNVLGKRQRESRSRESSAEYESADEGGRDTHRESTLSTAVRTKLPTGSLSPQKRKSQSPSPFLRHGTEFRGTSLEAVVKQEESHDGTIMPAVERRRANCVILGLSVLVQKLTYIDTRLRMDFEHHHPKFESVTFIGQIFRKAMSCSWYYLVMSIIAAVVVLMASRAVFQPAENLPSPDLVKVATLARSFEPLMFYSENAQGQVSDIQQTGLAVWDLAESVRATNMTSAPIIVKELDELSDSLKVLSIELARFFANVDGDVDGILIVMDWARRELTQVQQAPPSSFTSAFDNIHTMLSKVGLLETPTGVPTPIGVVATNVFGMSSPQRTRQTLQRTFKEFLTVLDDAISSELGHAVQLFAFFEKIDHQFKSLSRSVSRELDTQEMDEDKVLTSLWGRFMGLDVVTKHKFEKNKKLLADIRSATQENKLALVDHESKLLTLRANLDYLRKKLVSPLIKTNSSTIQIESQIQGLEIASGHLGRVREKQKGKQMERLYGAGSHNARHANKPVEIEGRWE